MKKADIIAVDKSNCYTIGIGPNIPGGSDSRPQYI